MFFIQNYFFYETRCKEKCCTSSQWNELKSIFPSAKRNHTQRPWKDCSGQDFSLWNEAFHMHIRLVLVCEKTFHIGIRPDFIAQLGLALFWQSKVHKFLSGSFHKMLDIMMKCLLLTITYQWPLKLCIRHRSTYTMWKSKNDKTVFLLMAKVLGETYFLSWVYILWSQVYVLKLLAQLIYISAYPSVTLYYTVEPRYKEVGCIM